MIFLTLSLLVFNDKFKTSSNCVWNTYTSSITSFNINWFTTSSVDVFVMGGGFGWLGTICEGEAAGTLGLTTDIFGVSTNIMHF